LDPPAYLRPAALASESTRRPSLSHPAVQTAPSRADFRSVFEHLLRRLPTGTVVDHAFIEVPSDQAPWLDTGIDLTAGEHFTTFAEGRTSLNGTDIWIGPAYQLWHRVGEHGAISRGTRASHTAPVEGAGRLYLASYFPGEWATPTGELATPPEAYQQVSGGMTVLVVRWSVEPIDGLRLLAALGDVDGLVESEIERLTEPVVPPDGWRYLWFIGPAEIYRRCPGDGSEPAICCDTHRDVGLLQKDVSLLLVPGTALRWSWKVDLLPSAVREDTLPTHDYLSIAVEFDNGQDITYYWSSELPVGTAYRCPIPTWTGRETHVVVRSGPTGLGEWLREERELHRDYVEYIGGTVPQRIVRVWLIALSVFQGRRGKCRYADIAIAAGDHVVPVR
jgi:hypothetical protein